MEKPVYVDFSKEANIIYSYISKRAFSSKSERIMLRAILRNIERIKTNPPSGDCIPKKLIPKEYAIKYGITNLYRMELPFFWRMLYTIRDKEVEIIAFVLDIVDHKEYNKIFKYE